MLISWDMVGVDTSIVDWDIELKNECVFDCGGEGAGEGGLVGKGDAKKA
jgi:hypothetical protein